MIKLLIFSLLCFVFGISPVFAKTTKPPTADPVYEIIGVPPTIHDNIIKRLKIAHVQLPQQAEKEILLAIQPFGYFHPTIRYIQKKQATSYYLIQLGEPLRVIKTDIKIVGPGKTNRIFQTLIDNKLPLKIGKIFTTEAYNKTQSLIFNSAHNNGYIKAEMIRHEVYVNLEKNEASIFLTLNTGPIFYYGVISFGSSPYSIDFLNRFIFFQAGQVYSPLAIQKLQENFLNSKYFSTATVTPKIDYVKASNTIPVQIDTQAVKSQQYNFGLGYGTNTGARTSIGFDLYRVTDTGQHLSALLNLSDINTSLTTKYYIPGNNPVSSQYVFGGYLGEFRPEVGDAYTKKIFFAYETKFNNFWSTASNINFLHERFTINNSPYRTTDLFYPSINLSRLSTDNPINPSKGTRVTLDTAISPPGMAEEFLQSELSAKWIYPPSKNNFIILRGDVGTTYAKDYSDNFPLSMRYFAGGYNSVRGYSYDSLGPGKYLKVGSAEVQQRIYEEFFVGIFLDEGNASDDLTQPLERGIGIDLIYRTSVGPLSIDIAQANTEPNKPLSIEFNFGANL